jgi:PPOX class probable F420-dependent enzyme
MADLSLVRELAAASGHLAVAATSRADGRVHASLVSAGVLDDPETGETSVGFVVAGTARKLTHLRRSGRASLVFKDGWNWVAVEGPVWIDGPDEDRPRATEQPLTSVLRDVFVAAGGTHDDWDEFDRVMAEDHRCAVFVHAQHISGNG